MSKGSIAGLAMAVVLGAAFAARAGDEIELKPCECVRAVTIDFATVFGLNSEAVQGLGARIDLAHRGPDPVGLAMAAKELQALESATGSKADISAEHLFEHAVRLAEMRNEAKELKTVAALIDDSEVSQRLLKAAALSQKHAEEREAQAKDGELDRGITNNLFVHNHSCQDVTIYYNGRHVGSVAPHGHRDFHICDWTGCSYDHWEIEARGCSGGYWRGVGHGRVSNHSVALSD